MLLTLSLLLLGIVLLLVGGTGLVRGASAIATRAGIAPLIVGLTVVAFGTSMPELVITVLSAVEGESNLAFGNLIGSNIANLGIVLGGAALLAPVAVQSQIMRREVPLLLLGTTVMVVMSLDNFLRGDGPMLDRGDALVLILLFGVFIYVTVSDLQRQNDDPLVTGVVNLPLGKTRNGDYVHDLGYLTGGILALALGGQLTISYGVELAEHLGVSTVFIGLFIVAIGTSLPELVTSMIAALKTEPDLCVGNVVGSNLINGLLILPIGAMIRPIPVPPFGVFDLLVSLAFTAVLIPLFIFGRRQLGRGVGALLIIAYCAYLLIRATVS